MRERTEQEYAEQSKALELVGIDKDHWDSLSPADRRTQYHRLIMRTLLKHHPDKHPEFAKDSEEFLQCEENTKLLNSISYDYGCRPPAEYSSGSQSSAAFRENSYSNHFDSSTRASGVFVPPRNAEELFTNLDRASYQFRKDGKGNDYYEAVKEYIPNLVPWTEWTKLDLGKCGNDLGFVVEQIATKSFLADFSGADVFVSAMVSRDKRRIKEAFDQMVADIKNRNIFLSIFSSTQSRLEELVNRFCRFTPSSDGGQILGIGGGTVLLLCESLSLRLPYQIINVYHDMDQELIRTLLSQYVFSPAPTLQLEDHMSHAAAIVNQTRK